jgi:hypothetical protein
MFEAVAFNAQTLKHARPCGTKDNPDRAKFAIVAPCSPELLQAITGRAAQLAFDFAGRAESKGVRSDFEFEGATGQLSIAANRPDSEEQILHTIVGAVPLTASIQRRRNGSRVATIEFALDSPSAADVWHLFSNHGVSATCKFTPTVIAPVAEEDRPAKKRSAQAQAALDRAGRGDDGEVAHV